MPKLKNPKWERFCQEYIIDCCGKDAFVRTGNKGKYPERRAYILLQDPRVKARVAELQAKVAEKLEITAERVLAELAKLGFSNIGDYLTFGDDGIKLEESSEMAKEVLAAVAEVSETKTQHGGSMRFKLHDKVNSLKLLGQHLKLFIERVEVDVDETMAGVVHALRKKREAEENGNSISD